MQEYDVVIIGSGVVGAAAALDLARHSSLQIALIDSGKILQDWQAGDYDARVSAVSLSSVKYFQKLNVWESILKKRISPYTRMHVWEESRSAKIDFNADELNETALGYIIEDKVMRASLNAALQELENVGFFQETKLTACIRKSTGIELCLADGTKIFTKLLIGADGANSWVRNHFGFATEVSDYNHTALVTTVKTELTHQSTAWQCFLKTGPLAFLPLQDPNSSSIVWSTTPENAKRLLNLNPDDFKKSLTLAFGSKLGEIKEFSKPFSFELKMRHAQQYIDDSVALIGDAAHTVHPLAGQGMNLGLLDSACLVQTIMDAVTKNRSFNSAATLRKYERTRKAENTMMLKGIGLIKNLFMTDSQNIQTIRNFGLNLTDKNFLLKNYFANCANHL